MKACDINKVDQLTKEILGKSLEILEKLNQESIDVYNFLCSEFEKGDVTSNLIFQFVYRSFYRLDNAGLTKALKEKYFELLQQYRSHNTIDPVPILKALNEIQTLKNKNSFQFSFTTKMINMIDPSYPIYDSKVSLAIIGSSYSPSGDFENKFRIYSERHDQIKNTYEHILKNNSFSDLFNAFDETFPDNRLKKRKKLDFIFWSYGKTL